MTKKRLDDMEQPKKYTDKSKLYRALKLISILALLGAILLLIYDSLYGGFLIGKGFGPGNYYYTDVPGWQKVFIDSPYVGFKHPVIAMGFFVVWAILMFKLLCWLDKKL